MAAVRGDPAELWNLFLTISRARSKIAEECDEECRTLEVIKERLDDRKKKLLAELEGLEAELAAARAKKEAAMEAGDPATEPEAMEEIVRERIRTLEEELDQVRQSRRKADGCRKRLEEDEKRCLASMKQGCRRVSRYTRLLEMLLFEEDFQDYMASAGDAISGEHGGRFRRMSFRGNTFYCDDDEVDPGRTDQQGRTNLVRMERGMAPIGSDGFPVNLHHVQQSDGGAVMELSRTMHFRNHRQLHINTHDIPSGINRSAFETLKGAYWRRRAAFIKRELGM